MFVLQCSISKIRYIIWTVFTLNFLSSMNWSSEQTSCYYNHYRHMKYDTDFCSTHEFEVQTFAFISYFVSCMLNLKICETPNVPL